MRISHRAFSHCRDVIAAVTNAGGFGMFGASGYDPDELDVELKWIDDHTGGRGYGIDVLIPLKFAPGDPADGLPEEHLQFIDRLMANTGSRSSPRTSARPSKRLSAGQAIWCHAPLICGTWARPIRCGCTPARSGRRPPG